MKQYRLFTGILCAVVLSLGFIPSLALAATTKPASITGTEAITKLITGLQSLTAADFEYKTIFFAQEPGKKKGAIVSSVVSQGTAQFASTTPPSIETSASATYVAGDETESVITDADFIKKGAYVYVRFPKTDVREVRNRWIKIPLAEYESFGEQAGLAGMFDLVEINTQQNDLKRTELFRALTAQNNLFVEYKKPTSKKKKGSEVITYYFEYNRDTVGAFFKSYLSTLSAEEKEASIFSVDGFEKGLSDSDFLDQLVENSYFVVSIDAKTGYPTEMIRFDVIPPYAWRDESITIVTDLLWKARSKKTTISEPTEYMSSAEALKFVK